MLSGKGNVKDLLSALEQPKSLSYFAEWERWLQSGQESVQLCRDIFGCPFQDLSGSPRNQLLMSLRPQDAGGGQRLP